MMRYLLLFGALFTLIVASGCAYSAAVRGQQGKAFVVKASPFGSTMWNCEASGGKPRCYQVVKQ